MKKWLICVAGFGGLAATASLGAAAEVVAQWEVDRAWSVHPSAQPILVTAGPAQYLAYYNDERRLTLAWRMLDEDVWRHRQFPVVTRWATRGHAQIGLAVDRHGHIHLVPYRRDLSEQPEAPPNAIYFRTTRPHDPESLTATSMASPDDPNPHYPKFLHSADGDLFFQFREGGSGRGNQHLYRHDADAGTWHALPMLHDGLSRMSPYGGPRLGPDGQWHCLWMWRDTPMADTNHTLSYMVSPDLVSWRTPDGVELELPIRPDDPHVVVEPAKPQEGLLNPHQWLGFDSQQRAVASYHLYAPCGNSAIFVARFEDGAWKRVAAHVWDFRWEFGDRGSIHVALNGGAVRPIGGNRLALDVWSERDGKRRVVLDETTLEPVALERVAANAHAPNAWRRAFNTPEVDFPQRPMHVHWGVGHGEDREPGIRYHVRWETGPTNLGDRPVPEPWPDPAPLRVFKVRLSGD